MSDNQNDDIDCELVIGLVSAVGTETRRVISMLREVLALAGYDVKTVKVSQEVISQLVDVSKIESDPFLRISGLMSAGNEARSLNGGNNAILARGVAARIFAERQKDSHSNPQPLSKTAFIVDSLKRPEEVAELRRIYPSGFILIGIHEDEERRRRFLNSSGMTKENVAILIERDAEEIAEPHGQRVNKTFHLADFFVRISENEDVLRCDINRMVELWFGNPFITPTFDEHAMFMAFASALRSADLSRQVGAVVTRDSQVLSTGANDCPKAGGGLYWALRSCEGGCVSDTPNGRDYTRNDGDSNRAEQVRLIDKIVEAGKKSGIDENSLRTVLHASGIRDLTEYGRVVHAEMEALLSCARSGLSTVGTTLYCTTFPCHNCAKHIIASGVERVVYVEPYPKSKALDFHDDAIKSPARREALVDSKVAFEPFVGIGPRRFFDLFSMQLGSSYPLIRKEEQTGKKIQWNIQNARLRIQMKPTSYLELEQIACRLFAENVRVPSDN